MDEDHQDESWEVDVQDDSEWYENEVDEYLSLYTLQSQLESREGENHSRILITTSMKSDLAQWPQGMVPLGQRKKGVITSFPQPG